MPNVDIYIQEFFLHTYNIVTAERASFLESNEGYTYVPFCYVDSMTQRLLHSFINQKQLSKWSTRIKNFIKRVKLQETDDNDTEYVDVDILMSEFMEEYKTAKVMFCKELTK